MDELIGGCAMCIGVVGEESCEGEGSYGGVSRVESRGRVATVESWGWAAIQESHWGTIAATVKSWGRLVVVVECYCGEDDPSIASLLWVVDSISCYETSIVVAMSSLEGSATLVELIN